MGGAGFGYLQVTLESNMKGGLGAGCVPTYTGGTRIVPDGVGLCHKGLLGGHCWDKGPCSWPWWRSEAALGWHLLVLGVCEQVV